MRLSALFPLLCALAAFILSLLCLLAGSTPSFLPSADLLTVCLPYLGFDLHQIDLLQLNTSRIGHTTLFNNSGSSSGFFSSLINGLEGDVNSLFDNITSDIAREFKIHDFYTAHIMNYCEGFYEPNTTVTGEEHPSENVTYCSNRTALFHFDPTTIIQKELAPGVNLTDLHWPSEIEDGVKAIEVASKVMFIFYCIGIGFAGLAVIGAAVAVLSNGRISALVNFLLDIVSSPSFTAVGIRTRAAPSTNLRQSAGGVVYCLVSWPLVCA